jgi:hypothetical protein
VADARVVKYVRAYAKVCQSVSKLQTLLRGNVDFPWTNEVEMLIVSSMFDARVVQYVSVLVLVSKLEMLLDSSNSNWRRFS